MALPKKATPAQPANTDKTKYARAFTASAQRMQLSDSRSRELMRKRIEMWQNEAWRFYDEIGEIWFAQNFIGNAVRRVRLFAAEIKEPDEPPVPLEGGGSLENRATLELERLNNADGGIAQLLFDIALNLSVAGDCTLVGWLDEDGREKWRCVALNALIERNNNWMILEHPDDKDGIVLPEDAFLLRIWCSHPRWHGLADSAMKGVLEHCDELQILSRQIRATGKSRLSAGLFLMPSEVDFGPVDNTADEGDGNAQSSQFVRDLISHMTTPIADDSSASAVVPFVLEMAAEYIEKVRLITFDRPIDPVAAAQRDELIRRIAQGIDLPPEILLGMASANHWTGWLIDDMTFAAHIENKVLAIVNALTAGFLQPAISDENPTSRNIVVWYDPADAVSNPNQLQDAKELHDRLALSDETLRRVANFAESDAPDDEEIQRRLAQKTAMTPDVAIELLKMTGILPADFEITPAAPEPEVVEETEVEDDETVDDTRQPPSEDEAEVLVSAGKKAPKVSPRLGPRLFMLDHDIRVSLGTAADGAVMRAVEMAGARMRRRVGTDKALAAKIAGIDNHHVCMTLGKETVTRFSEEDDLIVDGISTLQTKYNTLVRRAQQRVRDLAIEYDYDDIELIEQRQEEDRNAGWLILLAGLAVISRNRLFSSDVDVPAAGEFDPDIVVPANVIREALARAGGADISGSTTIATSIRGTTRALPDAQALLVGVDPHPAGGIATGELATEILRDVGLRVSSYSWVYGDASSRKSNFDPHMELDGVEFDSWTDPVLLADAGAFPFVPHYFPGDHLYCQCDFMPTIEER